MQKNIFKPTIGNESLHQDSNNNGVRIVNFAALKNLVVSLPFGRGPRVLMNVLVREHCAIDNQNF